MTFLWFTLGALLLVAVVITLIDIIRRGLSLGRAIGWSALVVVLPFAGCIAYWAMRPASGAEVEEQRRAQEEMRRSAAQRAIPGDSTRIGL